MVRIVDIVLSPSAAHEPERVRAAAEDALGLRPGEALGVRVEKRSIDGRARVPRIQLRVSVSTDGPLHPETVARPIFEDATHKPAVVIVGCGPAGLFAALRTLGRGYRPIVLERGKDVRARRRDLAAITQRGVVDGDSNYCFGEGGAGTYSDGKLYTRSGKRGDVQEILRTLVAFGASPDILVDAHPHIGTNKLPGIIAAMRDAILEAGGEVRFSSRVVNFLVEKNRIAGVTLQSGEELRCPRVILATGHSARDIFTRLHESGVRVERKDFALGVRVEHPQSVIDRIRYHTPDRGPHLPAASYAAVEQVQGLGVYSFCMCPGGIIAPCATSPEEIVTNGWSPSKRNNPFANSGVVVEIRSPGVSMERLVGTGRGSDADDPLIGLRYQAAIERAAWEAGGRTQTAPAQRLIDFVEGRLSRDLPACSYTPGVVAHRVDTLLPRDVSERLQRGLRAFGSKMKGYLTNDAVVVAVESRTSSPVRIPRDPTRLEHPEVAGLFPCGEGAGYAGGIVSAAIDGVRCADRCVDLYPS